MMRTVFLCLDGGTFSILDHLMEDGTMPFLKEFVADGVRAELPSTPHPLTPPAFTSIMTGRSPGNHGIYDFIRAEERNEELYFTLYNSRDVRCETIWSIASRQDRKVISLNYPLMSPIQPVSGYVIPGMVHWRHLKQNVYPQSLYSELKSLPGFNAKELCWDFRVETKALQILPDQEYRDWVVHHIRRERQWFSIIRYLMQQDPAHLTAIVFDGVDKIQHLCWQFIDPNYLPEELSDREREIRELCMQYFRELDGFLREIVTLAGPEARFVMASDHGFGPTTEIFRANLYLEKLGYLRWKDDDPSLLENRRRKQDMVNLDWANTTAYVRTSSCNGVYIRVARQPGQTGIQPDQYQEFRQCLKEQLLNFRDPATGDRIVKRVLTKEEAFPGPAISEAPDLTLVLRDHGFVSIARDNPMVLRRPRPTGTHYPEGIFMARGPGIRRGVELEQLSILDVAPTLLYSLGLAIPEDFEGKVPFRVFEAAYLDAHPVTIGPPTQPVEAFAGSSSAKQKKTYSAEEEEHIYTQLRALGYIE